MKIKLFYLASTEVYTTNYVQSYLIGKFTFTLSAYDSLWGRKPVYCTIGSNWNYVYPKALITEYYV
jgi:hypothetical protein